MDASRTRLPRPLAPAALLACALLLLTGCTDSAPGSRAGQQGDTAQAAAPAAANDLQADYQRVIDDVLPSVVQIQAGDSLGSGVVYDDEGHVVTNAHVVGDGRSFRVTTARTEEALTARLVSSYPEQDLAVLKLDRLPEGMRAARFGDSSKAEVGQIVLAMGSPLGLSSSVTQGIVSAVGRTVTEGSEGGGTGATIGNMVQTSAAINPGNSGGALVNLDSEVIGIPTLAATDPGLGDSAAPGIGFAIPASMVRTVADQIIRDGRVTDSGRAALGVTARTVYKRQAPYARPQAPTPRDHLPAPAPYTPPHTTARARPAPPPRAPRSRPRAMSLTTTTPRHPATPDPHPVTWPPWQNQGT